MSGREFYRPGHLYSYPVYADGYDWKFRVDAVVEHPEDGERTALGWRFWQGQWEPIAYGEDDWDVQSHDPAGSFVVQSFEVAAAVAELGALPMPVGPEPQGLSVERLAEIRDRAVYLHANGVDADEYELELSASVDVPALLDEIARMRRVLREACDQVASLESDLGGATARVAELEADLGRERHEVNRVGQALRYRKDAYDRVLKQARDYYDRLEAVQHVCDEADRKGVTSGGMFTVVAVRGAATGKAAPQAEESADRLTRFFAPTQAYREEAAAEAGQRVEWCTGCNTDHDPDQCGYQPETGGGS